MTGDTFVLDLTLCTGDTLVSGSMSLTGDYSSSDFLLYTSFPGDYISNCITDLSLTGPFWSNKLMSRFWLSDLCLIGVFYLKDY